ncbi:MAG: site-specific integrase [Blautia sp.]|nr:site-specific integrase [Blautia sp.]
MAQSRKDSKGRVLRKGETVRADGTYQYAYYDEAKKRRYVYANDLISLRNKEEQIYKDSLDGIKSVEANNMILNDMFDKYMSTRSDLSPRTYAGYLYQYNAYVRNTIGFRKLSSIKYSDIVAFYTKLSDKENLSLGTIEHLHRELHPAFEMAVRDCIIRTNPTHSALGQFKKRSGVKRGIRTALKPEEQRAFLDFMDNHPVYDHWEPIFVFFMGTGLRVGELSGLTWKDVDLEKNEITVDHAAVYFAGKMNKSSEKVYMSTPKTSAGIRKVPLVKEVKEALKQIKKYQQENGIFCVQEIDGWRDFIFLNRFGRIFLQQDLDRALDRIIDAYNDAALHEAAKAHSEALVLPHFTCHSLRHTFCARFCENETNLKVIQSVMGHVDIKTTMDIYAEVSEERKKKSMDALAENLELF